jgi:hypothetical protein
MANSLTRKYQKAYESGLKTPISFGVITTSNTKDLSRKDLIHTLRNRIKAKDFIKKTSSTKSITRSLSSYQMSLSDLDLDGSSVESTDISRIGSPWLIVD